jgi:hypothetical protein
VRTLLRGLVCAAALSCITPPSAAQESQPQQQKNAQDTFFSGNVLSVSPDKLTVSRRTLTLTSVTKVFLLDANTRIEGKGKLQPKARVTVKFEKTDDGERAVHIIVR